MGWGGGRNGVIQVKRNKFSVIRRMSSAALMCSMVIIVNNTLGVVYLKVAESRS